MSCGIVFVGSCTPYGALVRVDTQIARIVSREIFGLGKSVRKETLHCLAGTLSFRNYYLTQFALQFDAALRADSGSMLTCLTYELRALYRPSTQ